MRIAVNARFLRADYIEGIGAFTWEVVRRLVRQRPRDEFFFYFDRSYDPRFLCGENVRPVVLPPPTRHPILWLLWFEGSLARAFARDRPDVFLSADGFLSLRARVPTLLVVHDVAFERVENGVSFSQRWYCRAMTPRWLRHAAKIATVSSFSKRELMAMYGIAEDRIEMIYNGASDTYRPATSSAQDEVRGRYARGCDYFLHIGSIHPRKNIANLLRAFDRFKQRTGRNTKLLLAGRLAWKYDDVLRTHAAMTHRDDVVFLGYVDESALPGILSAALALVCVSIYEGFALPVAEAMASAVPVIASSRAAIPEIAGDAAVYVEPNDPDAIAATMERVAGDASLRTVLTRLGLERATRFDWDTTATAVSRILSGMGGDGD